MAFPYLLVLVSVNQIGAFGPLYLICLFPWGEGWQLLEEVFLLRELISASEEIDSTCV